MISSSIVKAKIKRSKTELRDTVIWDESKDSNNISILKLFFKEGEEIILYYTNSNNYKWILTNQRLIFPENFKQYLLSEIKNVEFSNIIENPDTKITNEELDLYTDNDKFKIYLEKGTWHLFYEVFQFIINKDSNR